MTPADPPALDAIAELLPPLLGALERIAWVQRHLYPPLAAKLAETLTPHADALAAPLAALEDLACPDDLAFMRDRLAAVARETVEIVRAFHGGRGIARRRHRPVPGAAPRGARAGGAVPAGARARAREPVVPRARAPR